MRKQIINRLGAAHIRDTVQQFVEGGIDRFQAMESLQVSKTRLYVLKTSYLAARAAGKADEWTPGASGGNHMPECSDGARKFLRDVLSPGGDGKRPSYAFAAHEGITAETPLEDVNEHLACLVDYRNAFEIHRELHDTPESVWEAKIRAGQCKLRQPPRDGWWELVRAEWKGAVIGSRGRLLVDGILCPTECANGTRVWICRHIDGTLSLVLNKPEKGTSPKVVFTNNPRVDRG